MLSLKMHFQPTESESQLLRTIKNGATKREECVHIFDDDERLKRAIEGCLAKGFLEQNEMTFTLTPSGEEQV